MSDPVYVPDIVERALLQCLCDMLVDEGRPVCACFVYHGQTSPVGDRCQQEGTSNGQAWIRRVNARQDESGESTWAGARCGGGEFEFLYEMGIYRCISAIPDEDGNAPPVEAYNEDALMMHLDWLTLARVQCCWPFVDREGVEPFPVDVTVDEFFIQPSGPTGGCAGVLLTLGLVMPFLWWENEENGNGGEVDLGLFVSRAMGGG